MGHPVFNDTFREYSRNNRTVQVSKVQLWVKAQVIGETLFDEPMTSTIFFWMKTVLLNGVNQDV